VFSFCGLIVCCSVFHVQKKNKKQNRTLPAGSALDLVLTHFKNKKIKK